MTWPIVELGTVADTALGKMLDRGRSRGFPSVPYLRNVNVQWDRIDTTDLLEMELADDDRMRFEVGPGDLLVCEGGEIGRAAIWRRLDRIAYQKALHRVRSKGDLDLTFLRYVLEHRRNDGTLERLSTGSTIAHLPQQQLRRVPVPMPPLAEQRRIVEILEDHLSRLDAAQSGLELASKRAQSMLKSALWQATHGRGAPTALTAIAEVKLGRQRSPKNHAGDHMVPYLRAANVDWNRLRLEDVKSMNFTQVEVSTFALRDGDILLTEASGSASEVGKSAIFRGELKEVCFQNTLLRVRCTGADPDFVQKYLLAEAHAGRFVENARGVGIHHLGRSRLARWTIELPDERGQAEASRQAQGALDAVGHLAARLGDVQRRGEALRRAVLTAAFEGKLTGRHTDDEVIEELASV